MARPGSWALCHSPAPSSRRSGAACPSTSRWSDTTAARTRRVFRAAEPQTSKHTVVIGRARVRLVDALMRFDNDDDDEDDGAGEDGKEMIRNKKKGSLFGELPLADGTRKFEDWVRLTTLRIPAMAPGTAGGEPTNVVCGGLEVKLSFSTAEQISIELDWLSA
uniref:Uncharacterized protein n=1 Tax=Leersia perrieri TaxID=77586 RepID=A0A0D9VS26_9ORYZ